MDPIKFRAILRAPEIGERAAELAVVPPPQQGERTDLGEGTSGNSCPKLGDPSERKEKTLRAILRAPEVVQALYREGRISQADAARMGPKRGEENPPHDEGGLPRPAHAKQKRLRAILRAPEIGERAAELAVVAPSQQGERTDTSPHRAEKLKTTDKATRLRAILRAPEVVQDLYREGRILWWPPPWPALVVASASGRRYAPAWRLAGWEAFSLPTDLAPAPSRRHPLWPASPPQEIAP